MDEDTGELRHRKPEMLKASNRPAIGSEWLEKYWDQVYPRDEVIMEGFKMKPPKYYDDWMEKYHPDVIKEVKKERIAKATEAEKKDTDDFLRKYQIEQANIKKYERLAREL